LKTHNVKAARDWRAELKTNPKLIELNSRLSARQRELSGDKEFIVATERLRKEILGALKKFPKSVREFFHRFGYPTGTHQSELNDFIYSVAQASLRRLFRQYLKYVARFGTVLRLNKRRAVIALEYLIPWGSTFHVRLGRGRFEPINEVLDDDVPSEYFFESDDVQMPNALRAQVTSGAAKFVEIEDDNWTSVLSKLEYFAYYAEGLTFVLHKAEQPYLLCLVGEKVSNELWRRASKAVSAIHRENFNRGKAGRPADLVRFKKMIKVRKRPGLLKEKLAITGESEKNFLSEQAYSSRVGKSLRNQITP